MKEPITDGRNLAIALKTLQSGMNTFARVYEALETKYRPFLNSDFTAGFRGALNGS